MSRAAVNATPQAAIQQVTAEYSCVFTNYGGGTAMVGATYSVVNSWPVNNPDPIELDTTALTLPSTVTGLSGVTSFEVDAIVQAKSATAATVTVAGDSVDTLPNPPTQVPAITSLGAVTFGALGTGSVSLPPATLTISPVVGTTLKSPITCTTTTAAQDTQITVVKATGSFYKCTVTSGGQTATQSGLVNMAFAVSGKQTVGTTDTVTLSASDLLGLSGLPPGFTEAFSGSLAVQGAQSGSVKLTGTSTSAATGPFKATGKLKLTKAGTTHLLIPQTFTVTVSFQGASVPIGCTLQTSPAPTALTLKVTKAPAPQPSSGNGTHNGGTSNGGGTPAGAPATGGGLDPASATVPAAVGGGVALTASGGWLLMWARGRAKRRRSA